MESRIWQYAAMYPTLANCSDDEVNALLSSIYQHLSSHKIQVIYFAHSSPEKFVDTLFNEPERQEWLAWVSQLAERLPWVKSRGLDGEQGWRSFMLTWADRLEVLYRNCPFEKVRLQDAWRDRVVSLNDIDSFLSI